MQKPTGSGTPSTKKPLRSLRYRVNMLMEHPKPDIQEPVWLASYLVSVIIVNYHSSKVLSQCLASLGTEHQIIVVDNSVSATETSALKVLEKQYPNVRLLFSKSNIGFAKAVNQGAKEASGDALLILNPDAYLSKDALQEMLSQLGKDNVAASGPLICFPDGTEQAGGRRQTPTPARAFAKLFGLSRLGLMRDHNLAGTDLPSEPQEVEALSGACMLIRADVFHELGGMDEAYTMHCEDLDFCMRANLEGHKLMFVPSAVVVHEKGHSSRRKPFWVTWHLHRGMLRYYRKFFRHKYTPVMWVLVLTGSYVKLSFSLLSTAVSRMLKG